MGGLIFSMAGLVPSAFGAGVSFTCNSDINTLASADGYTGNLCNAIQSTVGGAYASLFSNANANIYIEFTSDAGLGASTEGFENLVTYAAYRAALISHSSGDAVDTAALASLTASEASVFSGTGGEVELTSALAQALGITGTFFGPNYIYGTQAPSTPSVNTSLSYCNVLSGSPTCYNGIIYLQNPGTISGGSQDYYFGQGTQTGSQYNIYSVIEHETDEILGTSSCVSGSNLSAGCNTNPSAADLFRYTAPNTPAAFPTTNAAYFSYNSGVTNVAWYNHAANGQDYADFNTASSGTTYNCAHVQDAQGCLGGGPLITTDGGAEVSILDAVGYNTQSTSTPEPATTGLFVSGLALVAGLVRRRRI
jgi:hypothetical protein